MPAPDPGFGPPFRHPKGSKGLPLSLNDHLHALYGRCLGAGITWKGALNFLYFGPGARRDVPAPGALGRRARAVPGQREIKAVGLGWDGSFCLGMERKTFSLTRSATIPCCRTIPGRRARVHLWHQLYTQRLAAQRPHLPLCAASLRYAGPQAQRGVASQDHRAPYFTKALQGINRAMER